MKLYKPEDCNLRIIRLYCFGCKKDLLIEIEMGEKANRLSCPYCGKKHSFKAFKNGTINQRVV